MRIQFFFGTRFIILSSLALAVVLGSFSACGVKAPPSGYKKDPDPHHQILVCTPKHPECELTNDKYVPLGAPYEKPPEKE